MTAPMRIPYGRQEITEADIAAVIDVLQSEYLTQGPAVDAFEAAFATYVGSRFAVAVANGTAALHLGAQALGVHAGTRVITTPMTFAASANCVRYCGGDVTFCDIEEGSWTLDPRRVRTMIESAPSGTFSGIIPVDYAGLPADLPSLHAIAREHGLWIMHDACHSPGATFLDTSGSNRRCGDGSHADLTVFSFHPVKHIATGEGGMITTNNEELYHRLRVLRTHGITREPALMHEQHGGWYYEMQELGYNYRLTDIQAALGLSQLSRAQDNLEKRRRIADRYHSALADLPLELPYGKIGRDHAWHLFVIRSGRRRELYDTLRTRGVFTQVHYIPVHLMPYYRALGSAPGDCPVAEQHYARCLSLPMFPSLRDDEWDYVVASLHAAVGEYQD